MNTALNELGRELFDSFSLMSLELVAVVFFFHPVVWLCGIKLRREAEKACEIWSYSPLTAQNCMLGV